MPKTPSVSIIPLYAVIKGGEMWLLVKRKHGHVQLLSLLWTWQYCFPASPVCFYNPFLKNCCFTATNRVSSVAAVSGLHHSIPQQRSHENQIRMTRQKSEQVRPRLKSNYKSSHPIEQLWLFIHLHDFAVIIVGIAVAKTSVATQRKPWKIAGNVRWLL